MRLMYLGTAAAEGVPAVFCDCAHCAYARKAGGVEVRTRSGALIDDVIKLDFPADAYMQALTRGLCFARLKHILITHTHSDHFSPETLAMRRPPYSQVSKAEPPLTVYGSDAGYDLIKRELQSGVLEYETLKAYTEYSIGGYRVTPLPAVHAFEESAFIYYIEKDGKALLYAHDTDRLRQEHFEFLSGKALSIVSMDCTNGALKVDYIGHMGIEDNLWLKQTLTGLGCADENTRFVANHFSHNGLLKHAEMRARLPGITVAYDGLIVEA